MGGGGGFGSVSPPASGGCSAGHDAALFAMGLGVGMVVATALGGPAIDTARASVCAAAEAFGTRVNKNVVFWAMAACVAANTCFGIGSVIGKMGLPNVNPILFAMCREIGASALLVGAAWRTHGLLVRACAATPPNALSLTLVASMSEQLMSLR
jgi:hypothetical protein